MKKLVLSLIMVAALTGCASTEYAQYTATQQSIATSKANSETARYQALAQIAKDGDPTAKVAAVMALALGGQGSSAQVGVQAPQANQALQWASILVPSVTQVAGMRYNYLSQQTSSNNAASVAISTNNTMSAIAGKIQAPVANVSSITTSTDNHSVSTDSHAISNVTTSTDTATTLSGTGTLGSGAYSTSSSTPVVVVPDVVQITPVVVPNVVQIVPIANPNVPAVL